MNKTSYDPKTKIWSGPKISHLYNPDQNLGELLLQCLHFQSSKIVQICADTGVALTGKQFRERAIVMAQYLQQFNFKKDDFVGFVNYNTENLVPCVYACFCLGIPICPLSPFMTSDDITKIISSISMPLIFCDKKNLVNVQAANSELKRNPKILTIMEKIAGYDCATEIMKNADYSRIEDFVCPQVDPHSMLAIICSSGTTGTPKKIIKTHHEVITHFHRGWILNRINPAVTFNYLALFWISGFNQTIFPTLNHATTVITRELSMPTEDFIDIMHKYKITHVITLPFMACQILDTKNLQPFEYCESWMMSGFAATQSVCDKLKTYLPNGKIWVSYGLTEKFIISCNLSDEYDHIGYLNDNIQVKLLDTNGNQVGPNQTGEICIKDEPKFGGYLHDPQRTMETVIDGWFHTSDFAYFDDSCILRYVDRKVEIMNYEGYYIIPHEIESIINQVDGVVSSSIVGILEKEAVRHIIHAFVIADKEKNLNEKDILDYVHSRVIEQRQIRGGVHFVDSFPLGRTGKVDRMKLREMASKLTQAGTKVAE